MQVCIFIFIPKDIHLSIGLIFKKMSAKIVNIFLSIIFSIC